MKVKVADNGDVEIAISERNLKTLNAMWEMAGRGELLPVLHRTQSQDAPGEDGRHISIQIEPDMLHYLDRPLGPGIGPEDV